MPVSFNNLTLLCMYKLIEKLRKWIEDGGSEVSYCWRGRLQITNGGGTKMIHVVMD